LKKKYVFFFFFFRFFANNSISKTEDSAFSKGESGKSSPKNEVLSSLYKPVHSNTANVYSSVTHRAITDSEVAQDPEKDLEKQASDESDLSSVSITEVSKHHFKFSDVKGNNSLKSSPKGQSAFKWSKFKFNRTSSTDSLSVSKNSKEVKNPFKKVVSESCLDTFLKNKKGNSDNESVNNDRVVSLDSDSMATESDDSVAQSSYPYSIDSDCINDYDILETDSQTLYDSQKSDTSVVTDKSSNDNRTCNQNKTGLSIYFKSRHKSESPISADVNRNYNEVSQNLDTADNFKNNSNQPNENEFTIKGDNSESQTVVLIDSDEDSTCGLQIPAPFPRVIFFFNKALVKSNC
jgi:hypothetical protein